MSNVSISDEPAGAGAAGGRERRSGRDRQLAKAKYSTDLRGAKNSRNIIQVMLGKDTTGRVSAMGYSGVRYFNERRSLLSRDSKSQQGYLVEQAEAHLSATLLGLRALDELKEHISGTKVYKMFGEGVSNGAQKDFNVREVETLLWCWLKALDDKKGLEEEERHKRQVNALGLCAEWMKLLIKLHITGDYYDVVDYITTEAMALSVNEETGGGVWCELIELIQITYERKSFKKQKDFSEEEAVVRNVVSILEVGQRVEDDESEDVDWFELGINASIDHYRGESLPESVVAKGGRHTAAYEKAMVLLGLKTEVIARAKLISTEE